MFVFEVVVTVTAAAAAAAAAALVTSLSKNCGVVLVSLGGRVILAYNRKNNVTS